MPEDMSSTVTIQVFQICMGQQEGSPVQLRSPLPRTMPARIASASGTLRTRSLERLGRPEIRYGLRVRH